MTKSADDDHPSQDPNSSGSERPSENSPAEPAAADTAAAAVAEMSPADDLPEWEPLTPELVEDEAIRGDFVMRWAVVGLAILLGCSQIAESKTLVHIRSGEYLAQHGFLPPSTDVFSYTREGQPWVNLSWLFDLAAAGVHGLGGGVGLSLFQALLAAVAFGLLVHTVRPGIRTWWGSICAALALLACFRQFTVQPELITLVGVAFTLWWLTRTQEGNDPRGLWSIVPVLWLWSLMDSRAFFGWGLLLLFGLGDVIGMAIGRPGFRDAARRKQFWTVTGVGFLAAAVHPFLYRAWLSPLTMYGVEYPAWRAAYTELTRSELWIVSMLDQRFWVALNFEGVAGLYLTLAAAASMLLNARRVPLAHVLIFTAINAAAVLASRELGVASLVNCVLATLNAQDWFLARYGQTYSTQWGFLLFSRGGRAVTVLGLFAMAYVIISGRIDGPNGKRTGLGFDADLQMQMESYRQALADSYDHRPFPFVVRQGDLIIWAGRKSFIDSRLELFHDADNDNLIQLHDKTRRALRRKEPRLEGSGDPAHWRKLFDQYEVTHVVPRMRGLSLQANYRTFDDLLRSPYWKLTNLTPAVAVFYRADKRQDKELRAYLERHQRDAVQQAFRGEEQPVQEAHVWPTRGTDYQRILSLPRIAVPGEVSQAAHELHFAMQEGMPMSQRLAALHLSVRAARAGLRSDPNSADGYQMLGSAYSVLDQFENLQLRQYGVELPHLLRYFQIVSALQSSVLLEPDNPFVHQELGALYLRLNKWDLALQHLKEVLRLQGDLPPEAEEAQIKQVEQLHTMAEQLESRLTTIQNQIEEQLSQGTNRINIALAAYQQGAVLAAVKLMDDDKIALLQSPPAQVMYGGWLVEVGRAEEADQIQRSIEQQAGPAATLIPGWRDNAVYAAWAQGNYERVTQLYETAVKQSEQRRLQSALVSGPLTSAASAQIPPDRYPWLHVAAMEEVERDRPYDLGSTLLHLTFCRLEQGDIPAATEALRTALDRAPLSPVRPLLVIYWQCLTDERLEMEPASDWIPITKDLFAEEPQPE